MKLYDMPDEIERQERAEELSVNQTLLSTEPEGQRCGRCSSA